MKEVHKPALTANMAMVTDAKGNPIASDKITTTELNMLNNIRTNIQTQLDSKIETSSIKKAASGYVKLSNGLIVQWGKTSADMNKSYTLTFPTAFTTTNYSITANTLTSGSELFAYGIYTKTTTSVVIKSQGGSASSPCNWIAIGY